MWQTRLLVLGLVRWLQPVHGYEVHRELMSWEIDKWAGVKKGSIYHGLKRLTADGDLAVESVGQVANRPARTSYRITEQGEATFFELLRDKLWGAATTSGDFWIAWSFITILPQRESAAILRNRAGLLRDHTRSAQADLDRAGTSPEKTNYVPPHVWSSVSLQLDQVRLEIDWCEQTARRIEAGELYDESMDQRTTENAEHWKAHIRTLPDG